MSRWIEDSWVDPTRGADMALLCKTHWLRERIQQGCLDGISLIRWDFCWLHCLRFVTYDSNGTRRQQQSKIQRSEYEKSAAESVLLQWLRLSQDVENPLSLKLEGEAILQKPNIERGLWHWRIWPSCCAMLGCWVRLPGMIEPSIDYLVCTHPRSENWLSAYLASFVPTSFRFGQ